MIRSLNNFFFVTYKGVRHEVDNAAKLSGGGGGGHSAPPKTLILQKWV